HEHRERDGAHDAGPVGRPEDEREEREREEARDDRRDARHDVHEERDGPRERAAPVLDEIDGREKADRDRDDGRGARDEKRAHDRVDGAALGHLAEDAHHVRGQERGAEQARPARGHDPHERDERDHREREGARDEDAREAVGRAARALDGAGGGVEHDGVQHDGERDDAGHRRAGPEESDGERHGQCTRPGGPRCPRGQPACLDLAFQAERDHQLAPEKSLRRATMARAMKFTAKVMTNRARPVAIRTLTLSPEASGNWAAMFAAIVWCWPGLRRKNEKSSPGEMTMSTAIVSPSARPRPSIAAEITPGRPNGSTAMRIISQRVAPRASEASSWRTGVWRNTSRATAVMIGRIITASTIPAVRTFL